MKKLLLLILLVFTSICVGQNKRVTTKTNSAIKPPLVIIKGTAQDGRAVILRSDGTWDYDSSLPPAPVVPAAASTPMVIKEKSPEELKALADKSPISIQIKYDEFKDNTFVAWTPTQSLINADTTLNTTFGFQFPGKSLRRDKRGIIALTFFSSSKDWKFLSYNELTLLVDGDRLTIGKAIADRKVNLGSVSETLIYILNDAQIAKLCPAKTLRFQIGSSEGSLTSDQIAALHVTCEMLN